MTFQAISPADVHWRPFDAFAGSVRIAMLSGHPEQPGLYVVRLHLTAGTRILPHVTPHDSIFTVLEGTLLIGFGDRFNNAMMNDYPVSSMIVIPAFSTFFYSALNGPLVLQRTTFVPAAALAI